MHNLPGKDASVQLASLMSDQSASVFSAHVCQVSFQARPGGRIRRAPCCPLEHLIQQRCEADSEADNYEREKPEMEQAARTVSGMKSELIHVCKVS